MAKHKGPRLDIPRVAGDALRAVDSVLARWVPGGKRQGREYVVRNPTRDDQRSGSFSINMDSGRWLDAATGDKGGDLVSLVAYLDKVSQVEACKRLAEFLRIDPAEADQRPAPPRPPAPARVEKYRAVLPIPAAALPSRPLAHPTLGRPSQSWAYLSAACEPLFYVERFDGVGARGKEYRPQSYGSTAGAAPGWERLAVQAPRPLYGLDRLAARPDAEVVLVEGEKAADAALELFPDAVAMTWPGGVKAIGEADFSPLAGRRTLYWPDNDKPGHESAERIAAALRAVGVGSFDLVNLKPFATNRPAPGAVISVPPAAGGWPEKADAADALAMGWTAWHLRQLDERGELRTAMAQTPGAPARGGAPADSGGDSGQTSPRFMATERGVFEIDTKTGDYRQLCGPLEVLARSRSEHGAQWGLLVRFRDHDGAVKDWNIPMALFSGDSSPDVLRGLLERGLPISAARDAKRHLLEYLQTVAPAARVVLVERLGWHGDAYMLPGRVIGKPVEPLHYYTDAPLVCRMESAGTLAQWRENVARLCVGNELASFAISAPFAGPLLDILASESGGFHFHGDSSLGKTTLLKLAASVCGLPGPGGYWFTWRGTDNAIEATAAMYCDRLLILDEIGQCDPRVIGEVLYMLGNGEGKARANDRGGARGIQHRWRLVFLSSGEKTLAQHMAEVRKAPAAGQDLRFLTIPARVHDAEDQARRLGIFRELHGHAHGAALSDHLVAQAMKYHGTAFPAFVERLVSEDRAALAEWILRKRADFTAAHLTAAASGQARRGAAKFALLGAAGELATQWGITGWPKGEALKAADFAFRAWLNFRGGEGNAEERAILDQLRRHFALYGESRYSRWEDEDNARIDRHAARTMERYGFVRDEETHLAGAGRSTTAIFYVLPEAFRHHVCEGIDPKRAARLLADLGALRSEKGKLLGKARLPGYGENPAGCYIIAADKLRASD